MSVRTWEVRDSRGWHDARARARAGDTIRVSCVSAGDLVYRVAGDGTPELVKEAA